MPWDLVGVTGRPRGGEDGATNASAETHVRTLLHPVHATTLGLTACLLIASSALGADRPRLRPTPEPAPTPAAASLPPAPSPEVVASPAALPSPDAGGVDGCLGVARPDVLAAVGSAAPSATPAATPSEGETQRLKLREIGVRMDVPASWLVLTTDELATLEELPAVAEALAGVEDGSLVVLGADVLPDGSCSAGTLVTVADLGEALPDRALAAAVELIAASLEAVPEVDGEVKTSSVDLPIGPAQRLTFHYDATTDGAPIAWWVRLDVLTASGHTLAFGYATPEADLDAAKPVVNGIAKSLREL